MLYPKTRSFSRRVLTFPLYLIFPSRYSSLLGDRNLTLLVDIGTFTKHSPFKRGTRLAPISRQLEPLFIRLEDICYVREWGRGMAGRVECNYFYRIQ